MRDRLHPLLLCAGLLGLALTGRAQEHADAGTDPHRLLADPAFRLQAGQAAGGKTFALLAIPPEARQAFYDWLVTTAKPVPDQALECRLLAWLARDLQRPSDEIQKADDLVLQAAPDLPEGWLNRADFYAAAAEREPEKAMWALDTFAQGLRRLDFAAHDWRAFLMGIDLNAWFDRASQAGKLAMIQEALSDAMQASKRGEAMWDAAPFVRSLLQSKAWRADPALEEKLLDAIAASQPHLLLGDTLGFIEMARALEIEGRRGLVTRIARMLVLAPVPQRDRAAGDPFPLRLLPAVARGASCPTAAGSCDSPSARPA